MAEALRPGIDVALVWYVSGLSPTVRSTCSSGVLLLSELVTVCWVWMGHPFICSLRQFLLWKYFPQFEQADGRAGVVNRERQCWQEFKQ